MLKQWCDMVHAIYMSKRSKQVYELVATVYAEASHACTSKSRNCVGVSKHLTCAWSWSDMNDILVEYVLYQLHRAGPKYAI